MATEPVAWTESEKRAEPGVVRHRVNAARSRFIVRAFSGDMLKIERVMKEEVLETAKYPDIIYESRSVSSNEIFEGQYRVSINGRLALHGVTRDFPVGALVIVSEDTLRATGEFTLLQTDFRIKPTMVAGGAIKLKDELRFSFDIVANRERGES